MTSVLLEIRIHTALDWFRRPSKEESTSRGGRISRVALAVAVSAARVQSAHAGDYYVSPTGNDNTGTGSTVAPWRTLGLAAGLVPPGDHTIHLAAGIYPENAQIMLKPRVSVIGAGPDQTIIKNGYYVPNDTFEYMLRLDATDGVIEDGAQRLEGFHIQGVANDNRTRQSGIRIRGRKNVTLRRLKLSDMGRGGVDIRARDAVVGGPRVEFLTGITVTECEFVDTAGRLGPASYGNLMLGGIEGGEFSHLKITESIGAGIRDWAGGWFRNTKFHHCTINMMPANRQDLAPGDQSPAIQLQHVAAHCEVHHCDLNNWLVLIHNETDDAAGWNLRIHHNTFRSDHLFVSPNGGQPFRIANHGISGVEIAWNYFADLTRSFAIWSGPEQGEIKGTSIHHNVFEGVSATANGIHVQPKDGRDINDTRIINNTFLKLQRAVLVEPLNNKKASGLQIANNLCLDDANPPPLHASAQIDLLAGAGRIENGFVRNHYFHGIEREKGVAQTGNSTLDLMPATHIFRYAAPPDAELFPLAASGLKPWPYFQLRSPGADSPNSAIDGGVAIAGITDGVWGLPDIGAYEWFPANGPAPPSVSIERQGTMVALRWSSSLGSRYWIEASATLLPGSWAAIAGPVTADPINPVTTEVMLEEPILSKHNYFRIRAEP
ncbi:MAG: hypothetical protein ACKV19_09960 [Verrucomicrobiales bacterium]